LGVAARRPDLVAGVIAIVNDVAGGRLTPAEAMARHIAMNPGTGEAEARQALADVAPVDPWATAAIIEGRLYEGFDIEDTLDRVSCPALVLAGNVKLGSLVREEDLEFLRAHTALVRMTRIASGGQGIVWDEPAIVNSEVADFVGAL
jgi:pimeloyl-ACP methyl ester carboxylesterase